MDWLYQRIKNRKNKNSSHREETWLDNCHAWNIRGKVKGTSGSYFTRQSVSKFLKKNMITVIWYKNLGWFITTTKKNPQKQRLPKMDWN